MLTVIRPFSTTIRRYAVGRELAPDELPEPRAASLLRAGYLAKPKPGKAPAAEADKPPALPAD